MADNDVIKRLLIKLGVDRSDFDNAMKEVKRTMDTLYQAEKAKSAQKKADAQSDAAAMQSQIAASKALASATDSHLQKLSDATKIRGKELDQMKEAVAQERVRLDAKAQVLRVMIQQGDIQGRNLRQLQQEVSLERSNLAIKQAQLRAALTAAATDRRQGFAGGLLQGFSSRLAGTIGFSVLSAEGLGRVFEILYEKVKHLGEAFVEATGPAQTLRKEFEFLAESRGKSPVEMLEKLRVATRNLVSDQKLFESANAFMRSGVKMSADEMYKLTQNVVAMARASGHSAPEALDALTRSFQTGRAYTLAYVTGLKNIQELTVRGIPAGADSTTRATLQMAQASRVFAEEAKQVVIPAATLPELLQQMHVQTENFIDGLAEGLTSTKSFQDALSNISNRLREMQPRLEAMAKSLGEKLAGAIQWVTTHATELKIAFLGLIGIRLADWVLMNSERWEAWGSVIKTVVQQLGFAKKAVQDLMVVQTAERIVGGGASASSESSLLSQAIAGGGTPEISPGIAKLLSTGKGGLAYGARSAQLAGRAGTGAVEEGGLFGGLAGLGELGVINVGAESTGGAALGGGAAAAVGGGAAAIAGVVAAAVAALGAIAYAAMDKNHATLRDMLNGVKEFGSQVAEIMKGAWDSVSGTLSKFVENLPFVQAVHELVKDTEKLNELSKAKTGKTIWQLIKEQTEEALINSTMLGKALSTVVGYLKELSEVGEGKKMLSAEMARRGSAGGLTGAAASEEARSEQARAKALADQSHLKEINLTLEHQLAQERLKIAEETAKARFEIIKEELDNEESALKAKYEVGLIDLQHYIEQEKSLRKKELDARLAEIETNRQQQIGMIRSQAQTVQTGENGQQTYQLEPPALTQQKIAQVNVQAKAQAIQAEAQYQKQLEQLLFQRLQDELAAQKTYQDAVTKLRKTGIDEQTKALEQHFKDGEVSADLYISKRKALIGEERDAVLAQLQLELDDSKQTDADKAKFAVQMIETRIDAEKKLAQVEAEDDAIRLQAAENRYKRELEFSKSQQQLAAYQTETGAPGATSQNIAVLQQAMDIEEQQLKILTDMLGKVQEGSKEWFQIVKDIGEVNSELSQTNRKLAESRDFMTPLAGLFSQASRLMGSAETKQWLSSLSAGLKELATWSKQINTQGGFQSSIKSLGSSFMGLFGGPGAKAQKPAKTPQEVADEATVKFGKTADTAASQIETLAKSSHETALKLQADWQKTVTDLNTKLNTAAANLSSSTMQPFTSAVQAATNALLSLANAAQGRTGGASSILSVTPERSIGGAVGGAPTNEAGVAGTLPGLAPTNEAGVAGTLPGVTGTAPVFNSTAEAVSKLGAAANKSQSGLQQWAGKFADFMGKFQGIASGIAGFAQSISGAKSTGQGILSGAMSGFSTGMQLGGPIGAAIGATLGATIGGIAGHKEAIAQAQATAIKTKLEEIKLQLQNNTMTIGQAVGQLEGLRASTVGTMRGTKGKKGQKAGLPQELQAINDEINQLLQEQQKLIQDLSTQLAVLLQPQQYQDILNNLDQIIQKYQQFASAASGNSQQMAMANQWLVASLQAYANQMANSVRSANEQAISDAEKLIDLQNQLNQEQLQEYDVLTSGVMGRQRSQAQTKGSQIEQIEQQKQQTQSEYNLQKYKVDAESKMFGLAQDRLGLEQQMTQLQEKDFDLWAAQVQAMQHTLGQLQGALGAGGQLPAGLLNATGGVDINAIEQLLGLSPTATGPQGVGQPFIQNEPAVFSEFVDIIDKNTSFSNFGQDLMAAAATPFGSSQRQTLINDLSANNWEIYKALQSAGAVSKPVNGKSNDPNWLNFFGWIMNQAQLITPGQQEGTVSTPALPTLPGFEAGGFVNQEGPAYLHSGEFVLPADVVSYLKKAISGTTSSLNKFSGITANPIFSGIFSANGANNGIVDNHQQIYSLTTSRVNLETNLLSQQRQQTMLEMDRMSQMSDLLNQMYGVKGSGVMSMEGAFAKVYELRGRYGSAGFRRETL